MRYTLLAAAVLCLAGTATSSADTTSDATEVATEADVRCVLVAINMANSGNPSLVTAGTMANMYFMGRLDARTPDLDLETRLIDDLHKLSQDDIRAEATRCGAILITRGAAMKSMGEDMIRKAQDEEQKKSQKGA
ncbi:MAG TPA: hypothetical protein VHU87_08540 [Rhizomicrobium sp.]|jgi:hypothetical protein|nr:hypothetical protein [Rhizomicrobium sp.]